MIHPTKFFLTIYNWFNSSNLNWLTFTGEKWCHRKIRVLKNIDNNVNNNNNNNDNNNNNNNL